MGELVTRHLTYRYLGWVVHLCTHKHIHTHNPCMDLSLVARNYTIALLHVFNKSDMAPAQGREGEKINQT